MIMKFNLNTMRTEKKIQFSDKKKTKWENYSCRTSGLKANVKRNEFYLKVQHTTTVFFLFKFSSSFSFAKQLCLTSLSCYLVSIICYSTQRNFLLVSALTKISYTTNMKESNMRETKKKKYYILFFFSYCMKL